MIIPLRSLRSFNENDIFLRLLRGLFMLLIRCLNAFVSAFLFLLFSRCETLACIIRNKRNLICGRSRRLVVAIIAREDGLVGEST